MLAVVRIPEDRKAVLIGRHGSTKRKIEKIAEVRISVIENEVEVEGDDINVLSAREIVKAIGRGFSPKVALKLIDENYQLLVINIKEYTTRQIRPVLARVIGTRGKTKRIIEEYTRTKISIYGKTVSIIGMPHDVQTAGEAVEMLINGAMHRTVYRFLEESKRKMENA